MIFGIAGFNVLLWCNMILVNAAPFRYKGEEYHPPTQPYSNHHDDKGEPREGIEYKELYEKGRRNGKILEDERRVYDDKLFNGGNEREEMVKEDRVTIPQRYNHDHVMEYERLREGEGYRNRKQYHIEKKEKEEEEEVAEQRQSYKLKQDYSNENDNEKYHYTSNEDEERLRQEE